MQEQWFLVPAIGSVYVNDVSILQTLLWKTPVLVKQTFSGISVGKVRLFTEVVYPS